MPQPPQQAPTPPYIPLLTGLPRSGSHLGQQLQTGLTVTYPLALGPVAKRPQPYCWGCSAGVPPATCVQLSDAPRQVPSLYMQPTPGATAYPSPTARSVPAGTVRKEARGRLRVSKWSLRTMLAETRTQPSLSTAPVPLLRLEFQASYTPSQKGPPAIHLGWRSAAVAAAEAAQQQRQTSGWPST